MKMLCFKLMIILCFCVNFSFAQKKDEQAKLYKFIANNSRIPTKLQSTNFFGVYYLKMLIVISKGNKTIVKQFSVSDSLVYQILPHYKELYTFNYLPFMGRKNSVNLVLPIIIRSSKNTYNRADSVNMDDAEKNFNSFWSSLTPKNNAFLEDALLLSPITNTYYGIKCGPTSTREDIKVKLIDSLKTDGIKLNR